MAQLAPHDVAKAVAYPLRAAVLERLYDRETSPIELAKEMGEPLPNVAYHVRSYTSSALSRSTATTGARRVAARLHRHGEDQP